MCYTATQVTKAYELQDFFKAKVAEHLATDSEKALYKADGFTHPELFILLNDKGEKLIDSYQWGLIPSWKKPLADMMKLSNSTLNAKSETVRALASFKASIKQQRCVIPVNSFFEYKHTGEGKQLVKQPYLIHPKENPFFNLAGIYSYYKNPADGHWLKTFSILTQPANILMADIHNTAKRMPLMLSNNLVDDWINPDSPESLVDDIMRFVCDDTSLSAYQVRRDLKKAENDESLLKPIENG